MLELASERTGRGCAPPGNKGTPRPLGWRAPHRDRFARVRQKFNLERPR
jgi:hypothetical protein